MISHRQQCSFVEQVMHRLDDERAYRAMKMLICLCLRSLAVRLPAAAESAARLADEYWLQGKSSAEELMLARGQLWTYLDGTGDCVTLRLNSTVAARAVICALYPHPDHEDYLDTLYYFADLLNRLGDHTRVFSAAADQVRERFGL